MMNIKNTLKTLGLLSLNIMNAEDFKLSIAKDLIKSEVKETKLEEKNLDQLITDLKAAKIKLEVANAQPEKIKFDSKDYEIKKKEDAESLIKETEEFKKETTTKDETGDWSPLTTTYSVYEVKDGKIIKTSKYGRMASQGAIASVILIGGYFGYTKMNNNSEAETVEVK